MTWAISHSQHRLWRRSRALVPATGLDRPSAVAGIGLLTALLGAWGGIVAFVGPSFGYRATVASSWQWTTTNWLLHLVPGAVALVAGLAIIGRAPASIRRPLGLAGLLVVGAGAWFVIGPAAWPIFESSAAYGPATGPTARFLNELGANLGPGVLLAVLGGMALKVATVTRPAETLGEPATGAPGSPAAPTGPGPDETIPPA